VTRGLRSVDSLFDFGFSHRSLLIGDVLHRPLG
jgi:hypothetical protein